MFLFPTLQEIEALEAAWREQRVWARTAADREDNEQFVTFKAPDGRMVDETDYYNLVSYKNFRYAADAVCEELSKLPRVSRVMLFGSVAQPLVKELPLMRHYRRAGREVWHHCKDVDLAVWLDDLGDLRALQLARSRGLNKLLAAGRGSVAHHQVELFLFLTGSDQYRGRLCSFKTCPKQGKVECAVAGCGEVRLLRQHHEFRFRDDALAEGRVVELYRRAT